MTDVETVPVKDFVLRGIKLKATCRTCGRERIIEGGLLARTFSPGLRKLQKAGGRRPSSVCGRNGQAR